jgi:hypothetical protein
MLWLLLLLPVLLLLVLLLILPLAPLSPGSITISSLVSSHSSGGYQVTLVVEDIKSSLHLQTYQCCYQSHSRHLSVSWAWEMYRLGVRLYCLVLEMYHLSDETYSRGWEV